MNVSAEETAFVQTIDAMAPDAPSRSGGWTTHHIVAHLAAGAAEVAINVSAFNKGGAAEVPATRGFEEREAPFRAMPWAQVRSAFDTHRYEMSAAIEAALAVDPGAVTPWTGRQMPIAAFVGHTRSEYALHRWDLAGDDATSMALLSIPEHTIHAVKVLGGPLIARGISTGATGTFRLASPGARTVSVTPSGLALDESEELGEVGKPADVTSDAASRLLLLWGRMPDDPTRFAADPGILVAVKKLLQGY